MLIHGLVRDAQGRKMSKSLGNGIDPLEMIDQYGCDALRFNLITGNSPGNDMRFYTEKLRGHAQLLPTRSGTPAGFLLMNLTIDQLQLPARAAGAGGQVDPVQAERL